MFHGKELQKINQKVSGIEKLIKRKVINYMLNGKVMIILLKFWINKKIQLYKMSYFPEPHTNKKKVEVELDLSNYATESDLKNATGIEKTNLLKKMI